MDGSLRGGVLITKICEYNQLDVEFILRGYQIPSPGAEAPRRMGQPKGPAGLPAKGRNASEAPPDGLPSPLRSGLSGRDFLIPAPGFAHGAGGRGHPG
jgi:hypothetical protein